MNMPNPISESLNKSEAVEPLQSVVNRLAELPPLEYEKCREKEAKQLGVRVSVLDGEVSKLSKNHGEAQNSNELFPDIEPWHEPVDGAELLDEIAATVKRFIICDDSTAIAASLWTTMTWLIDSVQIAPLAVITAPEKRCGKTQMLSLLGKLVCKPLSASNASPAALFRTIDMYCPTLLIDEADAFLKDNEELRGLLNAGHTRDSAFVLRTVGDKHEPKRFTLWGAKAVAGIGKLQDTLMDRAITLELRRKLPHESVERLRHSTSACFIPLRQKLLRWTNDHANEICYARPNLPEQLHDRAQDNWEPLLAIAVAVGNGWPEKAREAAIKLSLQADVSNSDSLGNELLQDIQEAFEIQRTERLSTTELINVLCEDEEKPWATYNRGKRLAPRQLSKRLKEYNISSKNIRTINGVKKGFELEQFTDAFSRYLSDHTLQTNRANDYGVADGKPVAATSILSATAKPNVDNDCSVVAHNLESVEETYI